MKKPQRPAVLQMPRLKAPYVVELRPENPPEARWIVWKLCEDDLNAYLVETRNGAMVLRSCGMEVFCDCRRTDLGALQHKLGEYGEQKKAQEHCAVLNEAWHLAYAKAEIEDGARVRAGDLSTHYLAPSEFVGPVEPWVVLVLRQLGIREDDVPF